MNLTTIEMPATQAREKVAEYLKAVRQRHNAEDAAILAGYRALASGRALIDLPETISAGGVDAQGRPMLAVCRADAQRVFMRRGARGDVVFSVAKPSGWRGGWEQTGEGSRGRKTIARITLRAGTLPEGKWVDAIARVPLVPPSLRPATSLAGYAVLWEADWEKAPVDPALLKHIGGDLWAVCAVWDLTPLEQKVLMGR